MVRDHCTIRSTSRAGSLRCAMLHVYDTIHGIDLFIQKVQPNYQLGIQPLVLLIACTRILRYMDYTNILGGHLQISKLDTGKSLICFCKIVVDEFKDEHLYQRPSDEDKARYLATMKRQGLTGYFSS